MSFLFVDRIVQSSPGEGIKGIKHITREDTYLIRNQQGEVCFMSPLIGETLGQLAAWNVMQYNDFTFRPVAGVVDCAKVYRPAYIGETLLLESYIDVLDAQAVQYHSTARIGEEIIFTIDGALGPLLPMGDFITREEVLDQFTSINHPGDWSAIKSLFSGASCDENNTSITTVSMTFDRILSDTPNLSMTAEKKVTHAAAYFSDHFPLKPVLPMTVLLECKLNLAQEFIARGNFPNSYQVRELRKIKMNEFVVPGDVIVCHVTVKRQSAEELILTYRSEVDGKRVCVLDVVLVAEGKPG